MEPGEVWNRFGGFFCRKEQFLFAGCLILVSAVFGKSTLRRGQQTLVCLNKRVLCAPSSTTRAAFQGPSTTAEVANRRKKSNRMSKNTFFLLQTPVLEWMNCIFVVSEEPHSSSFNNRNQQRQSLLPAELSFLRNTYNQAPNLPSTWEKER